MASLTHPSGGGRRSGVEETGLCGGPLPQAEQVTRTWTRSQSNCVTAIFVFGCLPVAERQLRLQHRLFQVLLPLLDSVLSLKTSVPEYPLLGPPAQHGACVFTLQCDRKGLEEALALNSSAIPAFSPEGCASSAHAFMAAGPQPPAKALSDQGHELEASSLALCGFVLMSPFPCIIRTYDGRFWAVVRRVWTIGSTLAT